MRCQAILAHVINLVAVFACANAMAQGSPSRGLSISQRWCSQCHGVTPDEGSHNPEAPRFVDVAAERSTTAYSLRVFFRTPHPTMPNFVLNRDDIEDIVSYILSLKQKR